MKITKSKGFRQEYCGTVVKIGEILPIEGRDRIVKTMVNGLSIVIGKDEFQTGDVAVYCANETQLHELFLHLNSMYDDKELNIDKEKKGYINKHGRVSNNCNLSEDICGYSTRFGDSVGDFSPLSNLTTVEIVQIGDYLGLPYDLVHKVPMDGLNVNENDEYITDEDILGVKYSDIHTYAREPHKLMESNPEVYEAIHEKERKNAFKLKPMPAYNPNI